MTCRGRIALVTTGIILAATAVSVSLLILQNDEQIRPISLVIPEGWRAAQIYEAVDKALRLPPGDTKNSLAKAHLVLPNAARGNPEGYLFPATYPLDEGTTPESLLRYMADTANNRFNGATITAGPQRNAMDVYRTVTIASIVQAEAATKTDRSRLRSHPLPEPVRLLQTRQVGSGVDPIEVGRGPDKWVRMEICSMASAPAS